MWQVYKVETAYGVNAAVYWESETRYVVEINRQYPPRGCSPIDVYEFSNQIDAIKKVNELVLKEVSSEKG